MIPHRSARATVYDRAVTICIAAPCWLPNTEKRIVLCCDTRVSYEWGSLDVGLKMQPLGPNCVAMVSGSWKNALRLVGHYKAYLKTSKLIGPSLLDQIKEPLRTFRKSLIDDETSRFGLSVDEFFSLSKLPKDIERQITDKIQAISIGCDLLIACIVDDRPIIFRVDNDGVERLDSYGAIGSGHFIAQTVLDHRGYRFTMTLPEAVYMVYEAKRLSEKADGVNASTLLGIMTPGDSFNPINVTMFNDQGIAMLQSAYHKSSVQNVPDLAGC